MSTALYEVGGDWGNYAAKSVRAGQTVIIRNVAMRYDGTDDEFRDLASMSGPNGHHDEEATESARFFFGGHQWVVGEAAYELALRTYSATSYSRYGTDEWYALGAASFLKLYGKRSGTIALTFSIPVSQFRAGRRDEIREMLVGQWQIETDDNKQLVYEVPGEMIDIIPEGLGSLAYLCLAESGKSILDRQLMESRVVLFDVGGFTLDVLTFQGFKFGQYNESLTTGLLHVRSEVESALKRKYNRTDIPDKILDEVLRTGMYQHAGHKPDNVKPIVEAAAIKLMKDALQIWQRDLGSGADYQTVIITGGGGPIIGPLLKPQLGHGDVRIIPAGQAHLANALGSLRRRNLIREMQRT